MSSYLLDTTLAKTLLDFATEVPKEFSSESYRLRFVVNRIQAYKWSGDTERALQLLRGEDFTALADEFRLAGAVLRDDFEEAIRIVRRIGADGPIKLGDYREWPLFRALRTTADFRTAISEIFQNRWTTCRYHQRLQKQDARADAQSTSS